jgi:hypothetical protein
MATDNAPSIPTQSSADATTADATPRVVERRVCVSKPNSAIEMTELFLTKEAQRTLGTILLDLADTKPK